ncbi:MAG: hypothetical protein RMI91_07600 [Gemmatales bacterium]|nr:hypothetical protein [Gemmatales bacterium]
MTHIRRFVGPLANLTAQTQYTYTSDYVSGITRLDSQGAIFAEPFFQFNDLGHITQIAFTLVSEQRK